MSRFTLLAAASVLLLLPLDAAGQQMHVHRMGPPPPDKVELSSPEAAVPIRSLEGRPIVDVKIGSKGPYPFIFDTGASGMVITGALADELQLEVLGEARVASPAGGAPKTGRIVRVDAIDIGAARVMGIDAVATELPAPAGGDVRGILSPALFPGYLVTFDFPAETLRIHSGELPAADDQEIFEYDAEERLPVVTLEVAGTKIDAHLDTGASHAISLPARYASSLPLDGPPVDAGHARLVDREVALTRARLKGSAKLGRFALDQPTIVFNEAIPLANIGAEVLRGFVMTIDRTHHRVRLQEAARPS
jgi:hypothetical protein